MSEQDHGHEVQIACVRVQRYDTPDVHTFAAVRQDELAAVLAGSDNVVTIQECELSLPPEITATFAAQLAAPLRPVRADIGDVTGDTWVTGPLKGQPRPKFWRPGHPPAMPAPYRCTYVSAGGYRCDMFGEGTKPCPAHQAGTRWDAMPDGGQHPDA